MPKKTFVTSLIPMALVLAALMLSACGGTSATEIEESDRPGNSVASIEARPPDEPLKPPSEVSEELNIVWEVWALLTREHVDRATLDPEAFAEAAIEGLLVALDDPHTNYVRPQAFAIENEELEGQFEGIGATVSMRQDGKLIIVAPVEGSPAKAAGIRPGDLILAVNGQSIEGLSLLEAVSIIRGPKGTDVTLLVQHLGDIDPVEIVITRGVIPLISVLVRSQPGDRIAHIRLTEFHANTASRLAEAVGQAVAGGAEGLILDVRDNPGGLLESVVDVTSLFLEDGLIIYEVDGSGDRRDLHARGDAVAPDLPLVILANQFSASASEILVGALQDHQRATVVGVSTFGKGSVNILRKLSNDGGLFLTHARWFTPTGRLIHPDGLQPDVEVTDIDAQEADIRQLQKAIEILEAQLDGRPPEGTT